MTWQGIRGHDAIAGRFRTAIQRGRLASTFLFVGAPGVGKRLFALKLAQALLCDTVPPETFNPCGRCAACTQVEVGTHPDVQIVSKPADKSTLPLELFIGDDEHRMREGLCYNLTLKPFSGKRRIAIIDDADYLNKEGANCLLKTLEEPPPKSVLILLGTSEQRQLPTIRSRCQIVRFLPLAKDDLRTILWEQRLVETEADADKAASLSHGGVESALRALDPSVLEFRMLFLDQLAADDFDQIKTAKFAAEFVEQAGKEAPAKRKRLLETLGIAEEFFACTLRSSSGLHDDVDPPLRAAVDTLLRRRPPGDEAIATCLERTIAARGHVEANASPQNVLDAWLDDVAAERR